MTSVLSEFAQIGPREKYLLAVAATANSVYTPVSGSTITSSMTDTAWAAVRTAAPTPTVGQLYRDLGKTTTTYSPTTGLSTERFVLAQLVSGASTEGSSGVIRYIRVWSAAGTGVAFARTG
jgi:hypothetical protein